MLGQQRYRSASGDDDSEPNKSHKTNHGQSAPSSARVRRAARACDRCRSSKLRCAAPDPSTDGTRCAHCVKMDLQCVYTNPLPSHAGPNAEPQSRGGDDDRLLRLEANVVKLLDLMGQKTGTRDERGSGGEPTEHSVRGDSHAHLVQTEPIDEASDPPANSRSTLEALSHLAAIDDPLPVTNATDFDAWLTPPSDPVDNGPSQDSGSNFVFDSLVTAAAGESDLQFPTTLQAGRQQRVESIPTVHSVSPNTSCDARKTPGSLHDGHHTSSEYNAAQARPIPKAGVGSRMAAFTEPSSHEAPFRPLTYNPDTFRNAEMSGPSREENSNGIYDDDGSRAQGGSTPKRGRGDPIDRGIFVEEEARALFDFFLEQIAFFMPIFQEPMTFDFVRHRSSFLLSTILAIAAKYNSTSTTRHNATGGEAAEPFGWDPLGSSGRNGVKPVDEDKWFEIRSLALSSYFQALISKVHCLEDVQAILLQCAWGLQDRGASPDPWMMTGSAYRLARRLGIHLAAGALLSGSAQPTARVVASLKTYMCLYAFDRFFTVGFGRPETEGFDESAIDTSLLLSVLHSSNNSNNFALLCSPESAACVAAYVELANIAKQYSRFVNVLLKEAPSTFLSEMRNISGRLDAFSSRWLWARSPLSAKLGLSGRPIKMLYNHIRLCLHSVPLKPISHPDSELFLQRTGLQGAAGSDILAKCLKKAQDCAVGIIQDFADDSRDDNETVLCYGFDYAFMVLAHSAAILLSMTTISVCGIGTSPSTYMPSTPSASGRPAGGMDSNAAKRYYEMAITAMVDSNRSANFFPCDMACNLGLIAQEMGISVAEWMSDNHGCRVGRHDQCACSRRDQGGDSAVDFGFLFDIDQFLQPGFLEDGSLFSSTLLM